MNLSRDLMPCPFCASPPENHATPAANGNMVSIAYEPSEDALVIFCGGCGVSMTSPELGDLAEGLFKRWNTRHVEAHK